MRTDLGIATGLMTLGLVGGLSLTALAAEPAPDFTLYDTTGQAVSLKAYRGAAVWLSFGATW